MKFVKKIMAFVLVAGMTLQCSNVYVSAATTQAKTEIATLTVKEATNKAIAKNSSIKNSIDTENLGDDTIDNAVEALNDATTDMAITAAQIKLMSAEMSRALNLKDIESQKQNVEYQVKKYFNTIINAEKDVELFDQSLEIARKDLAISKLKLELGMISQLDYDTAQLSFDAIESARLIKTSAIDTAYRDLNKYMGVDLNNRYNLQLELEYKPVGDLTISSYAENFVNKSLLVEQVQNGVKTAKFSVDNYTETYNPLTGEIINTGMTYEQALASYNKALRGLDDTKTSVYNGVISTYAGLKNSEVGIKSNEIDLEKAQKQLVVTEKMLELGQVTKLDVEKLKYDIHSKEIALEKSKNNYALLLEAFSNPNLLTSMSSAGSAGSDSGSAEGADGM